MARFVKRRWGLLTLLALLLTVGVLTYSYFQVNALASPSPALASTMTVRGTDVVCVGIDPNGTEPFAAGRRIEVRFQAYTDDDQFDLETEVDESNLFSLTFPLTSISGIGSGSGTFQHRVCSANYPGSSAWTTGWTDTTVTASTAADRSEEIPSDAAFAISPATATEQPGLSGFDQATADSCMLYSGSLSPTAVAVELASGRFRQPFNIIHYGTRLLGVDFKSLYCSRMEYDGPFGQCMSHTFNLILVMDEAGDSGQVITPDLRIYGVSRPNSSSDWVLPPGFCSKLTVDNDLNRWILTHRDGVQVHFYKAADGDPCYPIKITEPNENATKCLYTPSGELDKIVTDLDQEIAFSYSSGRLASVADHLSRSWTFAYDGNGRLESITYPSTTYLAPSIGQAVIDTNLSSVTVTRSRVTTLTYAAGSGLLMNSLSIMTDDRGADQYELTYDSHGRVTALEVLGGTTTIEYEIPGGSNPTPLTVLDTGNRTVRVTNPGGDITDYEIHDEGGNPGGTGKLGLRRKVQFTESGKGATPLRSGEPDYWETRVLHGNDDLLPAKTSRTFSSSMSVSFDSDEMPTNQPIEEFTYNQWRQITNYRLKVGTTVHTGYDKDFDTFDNFARVLTYTDPRAFEPRAFYAGLFFEHTYEYDAKGNLTTHYFPDVTRGVQTTQTAEESWECNAYGQETKYTDPNGNITIKEYYTGSSTGGTINTVGQYGGYLKLIKEGATGSTDLAVNSTTTFSVNSMGFATRTVDPRGGQTDIEFNALFEVVKKTDPTVTLGNAQTRRYETLTFYDGAGNVLLVRTTNSDHDGTTSANAYIDASTGYDEVGNAVETRQEVSNDDSEDLITKMGYNLSLQPVAVKYPRGNRVYTVFDERGCKLRDFVGIDDSGTVLQHYPGSRTATTLSGATFVGVNRFDYDSQMNLVKFVDYNGNAVNKKYDVFGRLAELSEQEGNGTKFEFSAASELLLVEQGTYVGATWTPSRRTYNRFDERGRMYQTTLDGDLGSDERDDADPGNVTICQPTPRILFDKGGRQTRGLDPRGKITDYVYDAMNREIEQTDDAGNKIKREYDSSSNMTGWENRPDLSAACASDESYYRTELTYNELGDLTSITELGKDGTSVNRTTWFKYNSRGQQTGRQGPQVEPGGAYHPTFDDGGRLISEIYSSSSTLSKVTYEYDGNGNRVAMSAYADVNGSPQITQYAYDFRDRCIRIVCPDSDDPIDGSGNGTDGEYDRTELTYDAHFNVTSETNPRGITFSRVFDKENRLLEETATASFALEGAAKRTFTYNSQGLMATAANDFVKVSCTYNNKGWKATEVQEVNLAGTGFTSGWSDPIKLTFDYDCGGHRTDAVVAAMPNFNPTNPSTGEPYPDIAIKREFDGLGRVKKVSGSYFDRQPGGWAEYVYCGKEKWTSKLLANGASLERTFDDVGVLASHIWNDDNGAMLLGFQYARDEAGNVLHEISGHDDDKADNYGYNERYELTGVNYREATATDYRNGGITYNNTFDYDANDNRVSAAYRDPFNIDAQVVDDYMINNGNEYTTITRDSVDYSTTYDKCGNPTEFLCKPSIGPEAGVHLQAQATFDALNRMVALTPGTNPALTYIYDAVGRRSVAYTGSSDARRFIWEDWEVVSERVLDGSDWILERVHLNGAAQNERILTAIDGNADFALSSSFNQPMNPTAAVTTDYEYYYLDNEMYTVCALLDATDDTKILEYYRYEVFGEVTVLPIVDGNSDGYEDTPLDQADNGSAVSSARGSNAAAGRASQFANHYTFTGHRVDNYSGLLYMRLRYYEPTTGRFLTRDPRQDPETNLYGYTENNPIDRYDPMGTSWLSKAWKKWKNIKSIVKKIAANVVKSIVDYIVPKLVALLTGDQKRHLGYSTAWDLTWNNGLYSWGITWQASGGPRSSEKQEHNWVVQRIKMTTVGYDLAFNQVIDPTKDGSVGDAGHQEYLEAWKVRYIGGFWPHVFRRSRQHSYPNEGPAVNLNGLYRNFPQGDTWDSGRVKPDADFGTKTVSGDAVWCRGKEPYSWKQINRPPSGPDDAIYDTPHFDQSGKYVAADANYGNHLQAIWGSNQRSNEIRRNRVYPFWR